MVDLVVEAIVEVLIEVMLRSAAAAAATATAVANIGCSSIRSSDLRRMRVKWRETLMDMLIESYIKQ